MSVDLDECDGSNDVQTHGMRVARKEHRCSSCRETIRPRDLYSYSFFVFDSTPSSVKRCLRCELIYLAVSEQLGPDLIPEERLRCGHTWEEQFGEPPPPDVARLAFITPDEVQAEMRLHFLKEKADGS